MSEKRSISYAEAGVSIDAGNRFVDRIRNAAESTYTRDVIAGIGGFGALFAARFSAMRQPVLVASTDGVGTKLLLHERFGTHRWAGEDLVAMCLNDLAAQGAEPLFFLDYIACGALQQDALASFVEGVADACRRCGCALIGGETAEMPGMYPEGRYDAAGFAVGVVDRDSVIDGGAICKGDVVVGVASSGVHANGFSLVRRILDETGADLSADLGGEPAWRRLLAPTKLYVGLLRAWRESGVRLHGCAHITGGGLYENIARVLPNGLCAEIAPCWEVPRVFPWLFSLAEVEPKERYRVFNMGIGFVAIVPEEDGKRALEAAVSAGERAWMIGKIVPGAGVKIEGID